MNIRKKLWFRWKLMSWDMVMHMRDNIHRTPRITRLKPSVKHGLSRRANNVRFCSRCKRNGRQSVSAWWKKLETAKSAPTKTVRERSENMQRHADKRWRVKDTERYALYEYGVYPTEKKMRTVYQPVWCPDSWESRLSICKNRDPEYSRSDKIEEGWGHKSTDICDRIS